MPGILTGVEYLENSGSKESTLGCSQILDHLQGQTRFDFILQVVGRL